MSLRSSIRALPALLRIGFLDAVAYRAEMIVWVLATTMPLIMLSLWLAVAEGGPVGRLGRPQFIAYFLAAFIVRQLTGSWASWQINMEIRDGTLAMRLLRPVSPLLGYAAENIAAMPLRALVSVPVAGAALLIVGTSQTCHDPVTWGMCGAAMLGAWLITLFANYAIGALAFFLESSSKVMDIWFATFFVFSGYLFPLELLPHALRVAVDWLPFRYQLGFPVELMTGALSRRAAFELLLHQWAFVLAMATIATSLWRRGVARFAAYGG